MIPSADYIVPVEIESQTHNVYVIKRPGVDNFLKEMGEIYEIVVFTASLSKVRYTCTTALTISTPTLYWICSISTMSSDIVCSEKVVTTIKGTTSK